MKKGEKYRSLRNWLFHGTRRIYFSYYADVGQNHAGFHPLWTLFIMKKKKKKKGRKLFLSFPRSFSDRFSVYFPVEIPEAWLWRGKKKNWRNSNYFGSRFETKFWRRIFLFPDRGIERDVLKSISFTSVSRMQSMDADSDGCISRSLGITEVRKRRRLLSLSLSLSLSQWLRYIDTRPRERERSICVQIA